MLTKDEQRLILWMWRTIAKHQPRNVTLKDLKNAYNSRVGTPHDQPFTANELLKCPSPKPKKCTLQDGSKSISKTLYTQPALYKALSNLERHDFITIRKGPLASMIEYGLFKEQTKRKRKKLLKEYGEIGISTRTKMIFLTPNGEWLGRILLENAEKSKNRQK